MSTTARSLTAPPPGAVHWERYDESDQEIMIMTVESGFIGWYGKEAVERLIHYLGYENEDELLQDRRDDDKNPFPSLAHFLIYTSPYVLRDEVFPDWRFTRSEHQDTPPPNAKYRDWYLHQWNLNRERSKANRLRLHRACANRLGIDVAMIQHVGILTNPRAVIRGSDPSETAAGLEVKLVIPGVDDLPKFIEQHDPQAAEG